MFSCFKLEMLKLFHFSNYYFDLLKVDISSFTPTEVKMYYIIVTELFNNWFGLAVHGCIVWILVISYN